MPFQSKPVLTPAEQSFYLVLKGCLDGQLAVFTKVGLGEIIEIKKGIDASTRQGLWNKISRKHLDFVLCDSQTFAPKMVIELDDKSHARQRAQARDRDKDEILEAAGVPLLRVEASRSYTTRELSEKLHAVLAEPRREDAGAAPSAPDRSSAPASCPATTQGRSCPACGAAMSIRISTRGDRKGEKFWGCSNYPTCRKTLPV